MASVGVAAEQPSSTEVFPWLKTLPVAPEYHPTLAEFEDPIGYIFKIEKEASKYGICKIIPPVPAPPKKTTIANLNRSLAARSGDSNPKSAPTFTTRQQQIGFCPRKQRPVQKPVWQSGENYTVPEFEAKAKSFEKNYSRKSSKRGLTSLEVETLYWKATVDKPFSVEYANDMPGSAFVPVGAKKSRGVGEPVTLAETAWNMRGVSRAKGSLLRFMKEEIPGVTSPMVYIAMMFSWFAWHVEDHDLHSLNYLHMGAGKTWYGVPREAAVAFEEVIRVHGYGGEINPLVTFATLGEKTTVMSPEVLLNAGVPCCRLVQNAGEFVVTFPRAYHSGFSHGFNCAEAANIATPGWLTVAKEAAVRRASINCPPMVSHVQLLYDLAISLCSRVPNRMNNEPRSSRLKDKKKSECETFVKQLFVQDVIHHNDLLYFLSNKSSAVVILPRNCVDNFSSSYNKLNAKKGLDSYSIGKRLPSDVDSQTKNNNNKVSNEGGGGGEVSPTDNRLSDQKLFSCVTCGILCFACVAIIQPTDTSARLFMSADRSFFSDSGIAGDGFKGVELEGGSQQETFSGHSGWTVNNNRDGLYEVPVQSSTDQIPATNQRLRPVSNNDVNNVSSSLNLLALNYGDSSDSEEELIEAEIPITEKNEVEIDGEEKRTFECRVEFETDSPVGSMPSNSSSWSRELPEVALSSSLRAHKNTVFPKSDEDSSRMHVFCLEHAVEVEQQLRQFGGSRLMLLCHPDYPKVEAEAKTVAEEVRTDYEWNDVPFRDATAGDEDKIRSALDGEEAMHGNGDWAVKLGINLYYSANLSRSPLYSKQMPYNFIIYAAFGRNSKPESHRKTPSGRQRKITVAGKWCGKVWMSNQVHPLLAERYPEDDEEEEEEIERESIDQNGKKSRKSIVESKSFRRARSPKEEEEENEINIETASINRTGKKRGKSTVESESFRRAKSPVEEEEEEDRIKDSGDRTPAPMSSFQQYYRRKPIKKEIVPLKVVNWGREPKEFINPPLLPSVAEEPEEGGPSTRLRKRTSKTPKQAEHKSVSKRPINPKPKKVPPAKVIMKNTRMNISEEEEEEEEEQEEEEHEHEQEEIYACEMEGCNMSFRSKQELLLHKRNICPVKGCGKKFFSHKYLVQHRRVHMDDRPLKCPWRGCKMTFKWAWARTEHIRVHTGARPYICTESGCGQTFRFVSDFSRHKRKTGHSRKKGKKG